MSSNEPEQGSPEAQKARAARLRGQIADLRRGVHPAGGSPKSPREFVDEQIPRRPKPKSDGPRCP